MIRQSRSVHFQYVTYSIFHFTVFNIYNERTVNMSRAAVLLVARDDNGEIYMYTCVFVSLKNLVIVFTCAGCSLRAVILSGKILITETVTYF